MKNYITVGLYLNLLTVHGYKILFVHDMGTVSHHLQLFPIVEKLLENGHQVTGVFFKSSKIQHKNYTEIMTPNVLEKFSAELSKLFMEKGGQSLFNWKFYYWFYNNWGTISKEITDSSFGTEEVQNLIKMSSFDTVVTMAMSNSVYAEIFNCSLIGFSTAGPFPMLMQGSGNVLNLNVQPSGVARYIEPMTLVERLTNHISNWMMEMRFNFMARDTHKARAEILKQDLAPLEDINRRRYTVLLTNSHPLTHGAWQYGPNIIEVGGLNVQKAKPLSEGFQTWLDAASNGAVLVSFGSVLKPSQMNPERLDLLLNVFKSLKQYSFIWKWDVDIEDVPENVKISSWLPQQDILSHPNLRVFVTHGGIGGVTEAIYHKANLVGIPFSNDQKPNLLRASGHGFAKILEWDQLSEKELITAIVDAMEDKDMVAALEKVNRLYTDREKTPVDKAVWWIEYICRNGLEGAKTLKPITGEVPWYQLNNLDVIAISVTIIMVCLGCAISCCKFCVKRCCVKKQKTE